MSNEKNISGSSHLANNVVHFSRLLRNAGLPIAMGQVLIALKALQIGGIRNKTDFYWVLHACLVSKRIHHEIFNQAFHLFWQKRNLLEKMMEILLPAQRFEAPKRKPKAGTQRLVDALSSYNIGKEKKVEEEIELDASFTASNREKFEQKDFEQMTNDEFEQACEAAVMLRTQLHRVKTRRTSKSKRGNILDHAASMQNALKTGGEIISLVKRTNKEIVPPLVVLLDISGSMSQYSRVMLHFLHTLSQVHQQVHVFTFGTRLTNISKQMQQKDPDHALELVSNAALDWSGGTRIREALFEFNKYWSRRVLGQRAHVLLITDGLEREYIKDLDRQVERLSKSCKKLIWLNPLLRYDGFEPKASGVKAILPHVDEFRSIHNLNSLKQIAEAITSPLTCTDYRSDRFRRAG